MTTSEARIKEKLGVSEDELVLAVLLNDHTYEIADAIPDPPRINGGRPRTYPKYLYVVYASLADIYESGRHAATMLDGPRLWAWMREVVAEKFPARPEMHLPEKPPERTWYLQFRKRHAVANVEALRLAHVRTGIAAAVEMGFPIDRPDLPFEFDDLDRRIECDGKVLDPITKAVPGDTKQVRTVNGETGEVTISERLVRASAGSKKHRVGGGDQVHGPKFWHATIHGTEPHRRAWLAADYVPGVAGERNSEPDIQMKNFRLLAKLAPGIVGANTDTVSRGVHLHEMQRSFGWIPIAPITAASVDPDSGERTEKEDFLRTITGAELGCRAGDVDLWCHGGWITRLVFADDGQRLLVPCEYRGPVRRKNDDGTYRTYVEYDVSCSCGGHTTRILERTYTNAEDDNRGFNRSENVRAVPSGSDTYTEYYPRRSDSEGSNTRIDDSLPLRRSRSYDPERQLLDLLAHGHVVNSLGILRWGRSGTRRQPETIAA